MHISEKTLSRAYVRGRDVKPQRKDAGGRKSKQPPNLPQTKLRLSKVQEGLRTKNQTLQPTTRMQKNWPPAVQKSSSWRNQPSIFGIFFNLKASRYNDNSSKLCKLTVSMTLTCFVLLVGSPDRLVFLVWMSHHRSKSCSCAFFFFFFFRRGSRYNCVARCCYMIQTT